MGVVASPSDHRLVRERGADIDAFVARFGRETVVHEDLLPGSSTPTVATIPPSGTAVYRNVDHCDWAAVSVEPRKRMAKAADSFGHPSNSVAATKPVTSLRNRW